MKLAGILNIYHKPHAITDSRTQSYRTQAHFVMGNLAAIMQISWRTHTNRQTHLLFQWGVYVCFWHGLWPLTWRTISRAASEVWLPVIKKWSLRFYRCVLTHILYTHTQARIHMLTHLYASHTLLRETAITQAWKNVMGYMWWDGNKRAKSHILNPKTQCMCQTKHLSLFGAYFKK